MSYTKRTWVTGETITAEKLNNIEDGVDDLNRQLSDKQDAPATAGTAGQVLGLDSNLNPVWMNQSGGGAKFPLSISITTQPNKVTYASGESFDPAGMVITMPLSDGTSVIVDNSKLSFNPSTFYNTSATGAPETQTLVITHTEGLYTLTTTLSVMVTAGTVYHYGFRFDSAESDPDYIVSYLADAVGMTPAHMDYANDVFDYGSWENAFFMPRPCMLKYDGTVDYYLDPDDYSKKADGTASDVADTTYQGNAMMEWGRDNQKIWYKVVPDATPTSCNVYISNYQYDSDFVCWPFINNQGDLVNHFYTPIYNGAIISSRLRSMSGIAGSDLCKGKTAPVERTAARANNEDLAIWDTEVYCDILLINYLLTLISKTTQTQTAFGEGLHTSGSESVNNGFTTGIHNAKGLFYGTNSGAAATYTNAVKVFGMENWWGFQWRRFGGMVNAKGTMKYKLTRGTGDGSTAEDYVVSTTLADYDSYLTGGTLPSANGTYIREMQFEDDGAYTPILANGSATTYYCDGLWTNNNQVDYACHGGASNYGSRCGAWCLTLDNAASLAYWSIGAAPSCKPLS